jgi:hypothetical protein
MGVILLFAGQLALFKNIDNNTVLVWSILGDSFLLSLFVLWRYHALRRPLGLVLFRVVWVTLLFILMNMFLSGFFLSL